MEFNKQTGLTSKTKIDSEQADSSGAGVGRVVEQKRKKKRKNS